MIIKICGMRDEQNIQDIEDLDINWMGFIFYSKSPRFVNKIPRYLPNRQKRVGVFVNSSLQYICKQALEFGLQLIQLHGKETPEFCQEVRQSTNLPIIKAFGINSTFDFSLIYIYESTVDYFLFDTSCSSVGGSGNTFDHSLLNQYTGKTPFLLSGGLGPDNINKIKQFYHPKCIGIDLNSKFEITPAFKDTYLLENFITSIRNK